MSSDEFRRDTLKEPRYLVWIPVLLGMALAIGLIGGASLDGKMPMISWSAQENDQGQNIRRLEEAIRFIDYKYVDKVNADSLADAALRALVRQLDPYSEYLSPAEVQIFREDSEGKYTGIGIEFHMIRDTLTVIGLVDPDGPAAVAGIVPGDQIISINGEPVSGIGLGPDSLSNLLRGANAQEELTLDIFSLTAGNKKSINVPRKEIYVNSIDFATVFDDRIAYIRIARFSSNAYRDFMEALESTIGASDRVDDLIIDLRGNPGGYLDEAVKIASQLFKEAGQLIVYTEGENSEKKDYRTTGKVFFNVDRVVVLLDNRSASGSEVLAGAIQDWDRGVIIGDTSFGKGLVQEQFELQNGGMVRLTTARYYTPSGRSIQRPFRKQVSKMEGSVAMSFGVEAIGSTGPEELFTTKKLKRSLPPNLGIIPDILIEQPDSKNFLSSFEDQNWFIHKAVILFRLNYGVWTDQFSSPDWKIKVGQFNIPWEKVLIPDDHEKWTGLSIDQKAIVEDRVKAEWVRLYKGEQGKREYLNQTDPCIKMAVETIQAEDPFDAIDLSLQR